MKKKNNSGFSLVELSIVLVILGLLVGGILGGQSLIHAAELRKVTTEFQGYQTAANAFYLKYDQLPGDFDMATRFWTEASDCANIATELPAGNMDGTCNGNANGRINSETGAVHEEYLHWQHLSLAGLIQESIDLRYDASAGIPEAYEGVLPRSAFTGAWWQVNFHSAISQANGYPLLDGDRYGNTLRLINLSTGMIALTPQDAWNIDTKLDDGLPAFGTVVAVSADTNSGGTTHSPNCTVTPDGDPALVGDMDAVYNLGFESTACILFFYYP